MNKSKANPQRPQISPGKFGVPRASAKSKTAALKYPIPNYRAPISLVSARLSGYARILETASAFVQRTIGGLLTILTILLSGLKRLGRSLMSQFSGCSPDQATARKSTGRNAYGSLTMSTNALNVALLPSKRLGHRSDSLFAYVSLVIFAGLAIRPEIIPDVFPRLAIVVLACHSIIRRF